MRSISVTFYVNDGTPTLGTSLGVDAKLSSIGKLGWALDEMLAKVTPNNVTFRVWDEDETIWNWFQTQIATGSGTQFFPPWVLLTVDGTKRFLGIVDIASIQRDLDAREVEIGAQDWSVLLRDLVLEGTDWERPLPKVLSSRTGAGPWTGYRWFFTGPEWIVFTGTLPSVQVDDKMTLQPSGPTYPVVDLRTDIPNVLFVKLSGFNAAFSTPYSFMRESATLSDQPYYTVMTTVDPDAPVKVFQIRLDVVDWLSPGDRLQTVDGSEILISDVDAEQRLVRTPEAVREKLLAGDKLYLTTESKETLIWQDALELAARAAAPYAVDFSRLTTTTLPHPILTWVPTRKGGVTLRGPRDIEATLATNIRIFGPSPVSFLGTPTAGWTEESGQVLHVPWTNHRTSAPAMLMPDRTAELAPKSGMRNRVSRDWHFTQPRTRLSDGTPKLDPDFDEPRYPWPEKVICYDYSQFRQILVTNPTASPYANSSLLEQRWNGSAWDTGTTVAWPVAGFHPCSIVPMIGTTATSGPVAPQGTALLALALSDAGAPELQVAFAGTVKRLALGTDYSYGRLVTTPWGAFIVTSKGYGRVTFDGTNIALSFVSVGNQDLSLMPTTFAAIDNASVWCMATGTTTDKEGVTSTNVFLLQMTPSPVAGTDPVMFVEKVSEGAPSVAMAVRAPSGSAIYGILGSRVFQISSDLPRIIERVRAVGLTGGEMVEHIAQLLNAVVWPSPEGVLNFIGRAQVAAPTVLTVDRVTVKQSRISENFFSVVRFTGANDDVYADAYGPVTGGRALEVNSHPCIWTEGGCFALATVYAQFFGYPRAKEVHQWFHENPNTAPPWDAILPWSHITPTGTTGAWIITSISEDLERGEADATLLKVAP